MLVPFNRHIAWYFGCVRLHISSLHYNKYFTVHATGHSANVWKSASDTASVRILRWSDSSCQIWTVRTALRQPEHVCVQLRRSTKTRPFWVTSRPGLCMCGHLKHTATYIQYLSHYPLVIIAQLSKVYIDEVHKRKKKKRLMHQSESVYCSRNDQFSYLYFSINILSFWRRNRTMRHDRSLTILVCYIVHECTSSHYLTFPQHTHTHNFANLHGHANLP